MDMAERKTHRQIGGKKNDLNRPHQEDAPPLPAEAQAPEYLREKANAKADQPDGVQPVTGIPQEKIQEKCKEEDDGQLKHVQTPG